MRVLMNALMFMLGKQAIHDQQGGECVQRDTSIWFGLRPSLVDSWKMNLFVQDWDERKKKEGEKKKKKRAMRMWQLWVMCDRWESGRENAEEKTRSGENKNKIMTPQGLQWEEVATDLSRRANNTVKSGRLKVDQFEGTLAPSSSLPVLRPQGISAGRVVHFIKTEISAVRKLPGWSESVWFHSSLKLN